MSDGVVNPLRIVFALAKNVRKQQRDHLLDGLLILPGAEWGATTDHSEANKRRGHLKLDLDFRIREGIEFVWFEGLLTAA